MKRILITGATGNVGQEVIHYLFKLNKDSEIIAAVRNVERSKKAFSAYPDIKFRQFDFDNRASFTSAFYKVDILFLLRPPHISNVEEYFQPLLQSAKNNGIEQIVFLSVQGADTSKVIPHNKIERLITALDFQYIFVRPSYFMQNLTTTLLPEILAKKSITLSAGKAKFNWVDVKNIGEASAHFMHSFNKYQNKAYEITGTENMNFAEVVTLMTEVLGKEFSYRSINPISFYFKKKKEGVPSGFALVMTLLHSLPRLQKEPKISTTYKMLTHTEPTSLANFIQREKDILLAASAKP